jgi:hypothetical protein
MILSAVFYFYTSIEYSNPQHDDTIQYSTVQYSTVKQLQCIDGMTVVTVTEYESLRY